MLQAGREKAVVWEHPEDPGLPLSKAENCPRTTLSPKAMCEGQGAVSGTGLPNWEEVTSEEEVTVTTQRSLEPSAGSSSPSPYLPSSFIRYSHLAIEHQALCWVLGIRR